LLIEGGADVNIQRGGKGWPRAGWTALHYAAGYGLIELIEPLLARGAGLNTLDDEGRTPLGVAIEEKQDQAVERLRQKGAKE
jgi:ankyrin repeat protein